MASQVISLLFDKDLWSLKEAKDWLKDHGYSDILTDETERYWRFRQLPSELFNKDRIRTIEFGKGIKAIIGFLDTKRNPYDDEEEMEEIEEIKEIEIKPKRYSKIKFDILNTYLKFKEEFEKEGVIEITNEYVEKVRDEIKKDIEKELKVEVDDELILDLPDILEQNKKLKIKISEKVGEFYNNLFKYLIVNDDKIEGTTYLRQILTNIIVKTYRRIRTFYPELYYNSDELATLAYEIMIYDKFNFFLKILLSYKRFYKDKEVDFIKYFLKNLKQTLLYYFDYEGKSKTRLISLEELKDMEKRFKNIPPTQSSINDIDFAIQLFREDISKYLDEEKDLLFDNIIDFVSAIKDIQEFEQKYYIYLGESEFKNSLLYKVIKSIEKLPTLSEDEKNRVIKQIKKWLTSIFKVYRRMKEKILINKEYIDRAIDFFKEVAKKEGFISPTYDDINTVLNMKIEEFKAIIKKIKEKHPKYADIKILNLRKNFFINLMTSYNRMYEKYKNGERYIIEKYKEIKDYLPKVEYEY